MTLKESVSELKKKVFAIKNRAPAVRFKGKEYLGKQGDWHVDVLHNIAREHKLDHEEFAELVLSKGKVRYGHHDLDTGETLWESFRYRA